MRRDNPSVQNHFLVNRAHGAVSQTTTLGVFTARARCRITRVEYENPTGLAADNTNAFAGTVVKGSGNTLVASLFNTDGDGGGASLGTAPILGTLSTVAGATVVEAGERVKLVLTEAGTATLPEGNLIVWFTEI